MGAIWLNLLGAAWNLRHFRESLDEDDIQIPPFF